MIDKLNSDLSAGKSNQVGQIALIEEWRVLSSNDPSGVLNSKRTDVPYTYTSKLIRKAVENAAPSLTEPLLGDNIIDVKGRNAIADEYARVRCRKLNKNWRLQVKPEELVEPLVKDLLVDGTVVLKVGWNGQYGTVKEVPIDNLIFDPIATSLDEVKFTIEQEKVSISDILGNPEWYGEHTLDTLSPLSATTTTDYDRSDIDGIDTSFNYTDRLRQLVSINTYYGIMEIDGVLKPIVAIWSDNFLINMFDSPYPDSWNGNPFVSTVYMPQSIGIYGKGIATILQDHQDIHSAIMRAIFKQLDSSALGQKGFREGLLDPANEKKFNAGKNFKFQGSNFDMWEGMFTPLSGDIFQLLDRIQIEAEELVGISRLNAGLDPRALNSNVSATASSLVNTNAQRRLLLVLRHLAGLLEQVFKKWIDLYDMAEGVVLELDVMVNVVNDTQKQERIQVLNMAMSTVAGNPMVPPEVMNELTADYLGALGLHEMAMKVRTTPLPEPNPMEGYLDVAERTAKIAKDKAQAEKYKTEAMEVAVDSELKAYGL